MGGWTGEGKDTIIWDGTIRAKQLIAESITTDKLTSPETALHPHQDVNTTASPEFNGLDVDTLNLNGNVISDSTGTISFNDENLTTTGNVNLNADDSKLKFGVGGPAEMYHDGVELIIDNADNQKISFADNNLTTTGKVGIGTAVTSIPLTIKTIGDRGIRIIESSGTEFYDIAVDVGGDLHFINDAGVITMKIRDFDGRVGIGTGANVPNALLELGGTSSMMSLAIRPNGDTWLGLQASDDDGLLWANNGKAGASNGNTIFTDFVNRNRDHGHNTLSPNPTIFIHSLTDVSSDNTEWMSFTHNQSDAEINTGKGGVEVNDKCKMTRIGGYAIKLTNKTGSNTIAGQLVKADTATDDAFVLSTGDDLEHFAVVLDSGISDGSEAWVVIYGIADVAMEDNTTATRANWVRISVTEAGYADATNANAPQPINQTHFTEVGHCIETVTAGGEGTHILARCILHFN